MKQKGFRLFLADEARIGQVLVNLLTNAVKYSPLADQVRVSVAKEHMQTIMRVQDCDIGIAADHHGHIFEQFYQVADALAYSWAGWGIGFSLEIIKRHQGRIWVKSTPGKGDIARHHFICLEKPFDLGVLLRLIAELLAA
jgi:signal transduction histidine kinase